MRQSDNTHIHHTASSVQDGDKTKFDQMTKWNGQNEKLRCRQVDGGSPKAVDSHSYGPQVVQVGLAPSS